MKTKRFGKWMLVVVVLLGGAMVPHTAVARYGHGHRHGGVVFEFGWPWYYPAAPYYPPVVVAPAAPAPPPVYIERERQPVSEPPPQNYWYYCAESRGYYPYVKECPGGWMQVVPQPQPRP